MAYIDTKYIGQCETCRYYRNGKCCTWCDCGESYSPGMSKIPTADVVEVVRCDKCKYWIVECKACAFVGTDLFGDLPPEKFFCARGERKEDVKL